MTWNPPFIVGLLCELNSQSHQFMYAIRISDPGKYLASTFFPLNEIVQPGTFFEGKFNGIGGQVFTE